MRIRRCSRKSILFIGPDYHCTYIYRDQLRKKGWRADIFVPDGYPSHLLYDDDNLKRSRKVKVIFFQGSQLEVLFDTFFYYFWMFTAAFKYDYLVYYGKIRHPFAIFQGLGLQRLIQKRILPDLSLFKLLNKVLIFIPPGCNDEFTKDQFRRFDDGNVCFNCGFADRCDDNVNGINIDIINKYFNVSLNAGFNEAPNFPSVVFKYKIIDFNRWNPNIEVPNVYQLPKTNALRVMHATSLHTRNSGGKNIKGTPAIEMAVSRLQIEGFRIDLIHLTDIHPKEMVYYQAQADVYIDQLIYGLWGSSGIEALALGKPLIAYIRPSWKNRFLQEFGYKSLPVIEANSQTIYAVLRELLENRELLDDVSQKSFAFAKEHYDPEMNVDKFVVLLEKLSNSPSSKFYGNL